MDCSDYKIGFIPECRSFIENQRFSLPAELEEKIIKIIKDEYRGHPECSQIKLASIFRYPISAICLMHYDFIPEKSNDYTARIFPSTPDVAEEAFSIFFDDIDNQYEIFIFSVENNQKLKALFEDS